MGALQRSAGDEREVREPPGVSLASRETPAGVVKGRSCLPETPTMRLANTVTRGAAVVRQRLQRRLQCAVLLRCAGEGKGVMLASCTQTDEEGAMQSPGAHLLFWAALAAHSSVLGHANQMRFTTRTGPSLSFFHRISRTLKSATNTGVHLVPL